jgi:hypothetical protein
MKAKILIATTVAAFACFAISSGVAKADTLAYFTITSDTQPTITFSLPLSPDVGALFDPGYGFEIDNVPITVGGLPGGTDDFIFASDANGGGFSDTVYFTYPPDYPGVFAAQLYTGPESSPTFIYGVFQGTYTDAPLALDPDATITISATPTPLPAALPMFASGLGALGLIAWRRKKKAAGAAA